jgi:hypothetical protein
VGKQVQFPIQDQTVSCQVDIIISNGIDQWSAASPNLLERKSRLLLAITFEILALYKNLAK